MTDFEDMRKRAAQQASYGNYWAAKTVSLIDQMARQASQLHAELDECTIRDVMGNVVDGYPIDLACAIQDALAQLPEPKQ